MQLNLCNPWQKKNKKNSHVLEDHEIMVKTMCTFYDPEIKMLKFQCNKTKKKNLRDIFSLIKIY